jgi:hypothetical protein
MADPTIAQFIENVLAIFPRATIDTDNNGQIVIYTDLTEDEASGKIVPLEVD